jgi:hypothetical protein
MQYLIKIINKHKLKAMLNVLAKLKNRHGIKSIKGFSKTYSKSIDNTIE